LAQLDKSLAGKDYGRFAAGEKSDFCYRNFCFFARVQKKNKGSVKKKRVPGIWKIEWQVAP